MPHCYSTASAQGAGEGHNASGLKKTHVLFTSHTSPTPTRLQSIFPKERKRTNDHIACENDELALQVQIPDGGQHALRERAGGVAERVPEHACCVCYL